MVPETRTETAEQLHCPACGGTGLSAGDQRVAKLFRCHACSHRFSRLGEEQRERYRSDYFEETHRNSFENPNYRLFELIYRKTREFLPRRRMRLLDVGCGDGAFPRYIGSRDQHLELWGLDLIHNEHPRIRFIQGDFLSDKTLHGERFDLICSLAVIEHVDDLDAYVSKLAALLQPDGVLFLMTVNNSGLVYQVGRLLDGVGVHTVHDRLYDPHHVQHFTVASLRETMRTRGFRVVFTRKHNFPLRAVDVPPSKSFVEWLYKFGVLLTFAASSVLRQGMLQTIACQKTLPEGRTDPGTWEETNGPID